jgi:hypothetical protein
MGLTAQQLFIAAGKEELAKLDGLGMVPGGSSVRDVLEGWSYVLLNESLPLPTLEEATIEAARTLEAPTLATHVQDSDFAYVVATRPDSSTTQLVLNAEDAAAYAEGVWALVQSRKGADSTDWRSWASNQMSEWSRLTPRQLSPGSVRALIVRRWDFAEQGLDSLLERMGLIVATVRSDFEGALHILDSGNVGRRGKKLRVPDLRFVLGSGSDFIGIWDRESPGPPLGRFTFSEYRKAYAEWFRLNTETS